MIPRRAMFGAPLLIAGPARAHSELRSSEPANGARLTSPPEMLTLRFNEGVRLTAVTLHDEAGRSIRLPLSRDITPRPIEQLAAPALGPGACRLEWRAISADGHPVRGTIRFTIAPMP